MKKSKLSGFYLLVLALSVFLLSSFHAIATHVVGAEISYKWISGNTFKLELFVYRDCASQIPISANQKIFYSAFSCKPTQDSINMVLTGPPIDVSPLCKGEPSTCMGGTNPGVQRFRFSGLVTLPYKCTDWVFYFRECNRSINIGTLLNPQNSCLYVEARLNNLSFPNNSSPKIGNDPVAYLCVGQPANLNPGATDENGDVLRYQLVAPRTNSIIPNIPDNNVVKFKPAFSYHNPMPTQSGFAFDSLNGQISFIPSQQIIGVTAMKISEYRNGVLIGSIMQDIQIQVKDCQNQTPSISGFGSGTSFEQLVCLGDSLNTEFTALDNDGGDSLKITWNNAISNASFQANTGVAITTASLKWKPTIADTGLHTFTLTAEDNHCPTTGSTTRSYNISVKPKPRIRVADSTIACGITIPISATVLSGQAPFSYSWPGRPETTKTITVGHGVYAVRVTDVTGCFAQDTIRLNGSSISAYVQTDTSCLVEGVQLTAVASSVNPALTFTYRWVFPPETQVFTGLTIRRTFDSSGVKNLILKVVASDSCSITIPATITVCPPPPALVQYAPNVCEGKPVRIGCGIPGLGGACGASTICIILTNRNWIAFPQTGVHVIPPDSMRPDSNSFQVITTSISKCSNQKRFKFKVKGAPHIKLLPDKDVIRYNCNKPDTTILVKIYKDYRFINDSIWGRIQFADTTIKIPKTKQDTIFYTLHLTKPGYITIVGIMDNNCTEFKTITYQPTAFPTANASKHCVATDSVTILSNLFQSPFIHYVFNLGNGNFTTDSIPKILFQPNQVYHGYFATEDSLGCKDTANFIVDTRLPDTTVFVATDSACLNSYIKIRVSDTTIVQQWSFKTSDSTNLLLPKGVMEDSLQFKLPGLNLVQVSIGYKQGCTKTWNLPPVFVRQRIWPTSGLSNVCAYDSSRFSGGISFAEFPIQKWKWEYQYPSNVSLPFSGDTIRNPVRLFNYNGRLRSILTVTDIMGCMAKDTLDSTMVMISKPEFDVNGDCQNDSLVFFFGRVPDQYENIDRFTYIYNDGSYETTSNGQGLHQFADPGIYKIKLIAYSLEGCFNQDSTTLVIKPRPTAHFGLPPPEICQGQIFMVDGHGSKPAAPDQKITSFVWATNEVNPYSKDTATQISVTEAGNSFVALQVRSTNGCQDYLKLPFVARPRPVPDFQPNEADLLRGDLISFLDLSTGGTEWHWDFGDGNHLHITDPSQSSPSHKYSFGTTFPVEQWVVNSFGCADSITRMVNLKSFIALPKAFSPNDDSRNDGCGLIYRFIRNLNEFKIYNRLGQLVFDAGSDLEARWNGKLEGVNQPNGSYLYIAKATSVFGENLELKGNITLVR